MISFNKLEIGGERDLELIEAPAPADYIKIFSLVRFFFKPAPASVTYCSDSAQFGFRGVGLNTQ